MAPENTTTIEPKGQVRTLQGSALTEVQEHIGEDFDKLGIVASMRFFAQWLIEQNKDVESPEARGAYNTVASCLRGTSQYVSGLPNR